MGFITLLVYKKPAKLNHSSLAEQIIQAQLQSGTKWWTILVGKYFHPDYIVLMNHYQGIFFDLDGTLVNSAPDIWTATNLTLQELDLPPIDLVRCTGFIGDGIERLIQRAIAYSLTESQSHLVIDLPTAIQLFKAYYAQHLLDTTHLYPGVKETLTRLTQYPLAVISNKSFDFTVRILEYLQIQPYFSCILGGDSLAVRKPDPGPFVHACKKLHVEPSKVLVVGDSDKDIRAARAISAAVCAVTYGFLSEAELQKWKPDYLISSFAELWTILNGNQSGI